MGTQEEAAIIIAGTIVPFGGFGPVEGVVVVEDEELLNGHQSRQCRRNHAQGTKTQMDMRHSGIPLFQGNIE